MRNEAASELASIPPSKANGEGSALLLLLLVLAPLPESDAVFIPSQRAIMAIQTIERWIGSDEDIDPVIESRTLSLLCHLAPILQSVMGRHWDFAFDLAENTLENSSLGDLESLVQLSRALDLISTISKFGSTNKQLNATWSTRRTVILRLARDLISTKDASLPSGALHDKCRSHTINILQEPPEGIIEADTLSKMVHLLQVPSLETQRGAYPLVRSAAQKYSEKIVLEVGLNPAADIDARLPLELMSLLESIGLWGDEETGDQEIGHASVSTSMRACFTV
jgi:E3 ubiquitin-protein ligase listerin